jgi:ferritin-like metal-binding protein YciE
MARDVRLPVETEIARDSLSCLVEVMTMSMASHTNHKSKGQQVATTTSADTEKNQKTIADYVGDMTALESHIEEALDRQLKETKDDPIAHAAVQKFHDMVKSHRDELRALQEQTGATAGNPIKDAGAAILGKAAGVIDMVRTEGISKSLRDDYAAFSLAAISYSMLHTTSSGLGDKRVASIAEKNLTDYAAAIERINEIMPEVVARELEKDDHKVQSGAIEATRKMVGKAWNTTTR